MTRPTPTGSPTGANAATGRWYCRRSAALKACRELSVTTRDHAFPATRRRSSTGLRPPSDSSSWLHIYSAFHQMTKNYSTPLRYIVTLSGLRPDQRRRPALSTLRSTDDAGKVSQAPGGVVVKSPLKWLSDRQEQARAQVDAWLSATPSDVTRDARRIVRLAGIDAWHVACGGWSLTFGEAASITLGRAMVDHGLSKEVARVLWADWKAAVYSDPYAGDGAHSCFDCRDWSRKVGRRFPPELCARGFASMIEAYAEGRIPLSHQPVYRRSLRTVVNADAYPVAGLGRAR